MVDGPLRSRLLAQLSTDEVTALNATYFQGRTLRQAADVLDQPVPVLVTRLRSALAKLARPQPL